MAIVGIEKATELITDKDGTEHETIYVYDDRSPRLPKKGQNEHIYPVLNDKGEVVALNCYPFIPKVERAK